VVPVALSALLELRTTPDPKRRIHNFFHLCIGKGKRINYFIPEEQDLTGRREGAAFFAEGRSPVRGIHVPACGGSGE
jgi:hypothetical protein